MWRAGQPVTHPSGGRWKSICKYLTLFLYLPGCNIQPDQEVEHVGCVSVAEDVACPDVNAAALPPQLCDAPELLELEQVLLFVYEEDCADTTTWDSGGGCGGRDLCCYNARWRVLPGESCKAT